MSQPLIAISRKTALLFALFVVMYEFSTYIANDMIMPGMLQVIQEFNAKESYVVTSLTAYMLGGLTLQLLLGPLSDRFGRRPVMLSGVVLFLFFTVVLVCSRSIEAFILARFFQGMGLCFIFAVGYAALQEIFAEMDAVRLMSLMANVALIAPLLGPLLGAIVIHYFNWRVIFILIGIIALTALVGLWKTMPETVGATLINGTVISRVSLKPKVIWQNYRDLLKNKAFMLGTLSMGIIWVPLLAWIGASPLIIVHYAGLSVVQYGLTQLPIFAAIITGNLYMRALTKTKSLEYMLWLGSIIQVTGLLLGAVLLWLDRGHYAFIIMGLTIYGFGGGIMNAPLTRITLFATDVAKGTSSALMNILNMAILTAGTQLTNWVYADGDNLAFGIYCALCGIIYFILIRLARK